MRPNYLASVAFIVGILTDTGGRAFKRDTAGAMLPRVRRADPPTFGYSLHVSFGSLLSFAVLRFLQNGRIPASDASALRPTTIVSAPGRSSDAGVGLDGSI